MSYASGDPTTKIKSTVQELQKELRTLIEEEKTAIAALNEFKKIKNELLIEQLELTSKLTDGKKGMHVQATQENVQPQVQAAPQNIVKNEPVRLNLDVDKLLTSLVDGQYCVSGSEHDSDEESSDDNTALSL